MDASSSASSTRVMEVMVVRGGDNASGDPPTLRVCQAILFNTFESGSVVPGMPVIHLSSPSICRSVVTYGVPTPIALHGDLWLAWRAKGLFSAQDGLCQS